MSLRAPKCYCDSASELELSFLKAASRSPRSSKTHHDATSLVGGETCKVFKPSKNSSRD
jgi:hypothetical protein